MKVIVSIQSQDPNKTYSIQIEEVMDEKWISQEEMRSLIGRETVFWQYRYLELLLRFLRDEYSRVFPAE